MEINELRSALRTGVPLMWQGKMEYERSVGYLSGIILRAGPRGEDVFSCELTTRQNRLLICKPEELNYYKPVESAERNNYEKRI